MVGASGLVSCVRNSDEIGSIGVRGGLEDAGGGGGVAVASVAAAVVVPAGGSAGRVGAG